ncbi:unnamed protein product, partial [Polarella glacialis]
VCQQKWPQLRLSKRSLVRQLNSELHWEDELAGSKSRVLLTLEPERVCHRLVWAIGDTIPPDRALRTVCQSLQKRWPQCHVRCTDSILFPSSVFRTMLLVTSVLLTISLRVLAVAAQVVFFPEPHAPP